MDKAVWALAWPTRRFVSALCKYFCTHRLCKQSISKGIKEICMVGRIIGVATLLCLYPKAAEQGEHWDTVPPPPHFENKKCALSL